MFAILGLLLSGLITGALARVIVPGRTKMGCLATALYGIGGSVVGGIIGRLLFGQDYTGPGIVMSVLCTAGIIWIVRNR